MTIELIQKKIKSGDYFFSKHGDDERKNDNLTILEVEEAILNGIILENINLSSIVYHTHSFTSLFIGKAQR